MIKVDYLISSIWDLLWFKEVQVTVTISVFPAFALSNTVKWSCQATNEPGVR